MDIRIIGWTLLFVLFSLFLKHNEKSFITEQKDAITLEEEVPLFDRLRNIRRDKISEQSLTPGFSDAEREISLENDKMKVYFSKTGGNIEKVILKEYKSYGGGELVLCDEDSIIENLNIKIKKDVENSEIVPKDCDVCLLPFSVKNVRISGGKEAIEFSYEAKSYLDNGCKFIVKKVFYFDDASEYLLQHDIEIEDVNDEIVSVQYQLNDFIIKQEKNLKDCQNHTTIKYIDSEDGSKYELYTSSNSEKECKNARWVNIMQKFFSFSIFSEEGLDNLRVSLSTPDNSVKNGSVSGYTQNDKKVRIVEVSKAKDDSSVVKEASVFFDINKKIQEGGKNKFCKKIKYYFGPNDFYIMKKMGNNLEESIYLGWPGARNIGKYLYLPFIKKMEEKRLPAWVLIIILIFLLKLFFFPFLVRGYLGMLKMKFLDPYFEALQKKYGDDFFAVVEERRKITTKANVNMVGFFLVNLMQLPFWNSIFNVFPHSMFFRQKAFLWCDDMSTYDSVLNFNFNLPLFGDHVSIFSLLMLVTIFIQLLSQGVLNKISRGKVMFLIAIALFFIMVNNNMCVCLTFYFFISSLLSNISQKCINIFVDQGKIKAEIDSILSKEGFTRE